MLRRRIVEALEPRRPEGLIGGFPKQQVSFGHHAVKAFHQLAGAHKLPSGTLYIDLRHAYHHLIRAFSLGAGLDGKDWHETLRNLADDAMQHGCERSLQQTCPLEEIFGEDSHLMHLLREVHTDTFCMVQGDWIRTSRGSRPGSPLADMVFSSLMLKLHQMFDKILEEDVELQAASKVLNFQPLTVTWADDVTIEVVGLSCQGLLDALQRTASKVFKLFKEHGLSLNLAPGKTSAVLIFRGTDAPAFRTRYVIEDRGCFVQMDGEDVWLPIVCSYKHLGTMATCAMNLDMEIAVRLGITRTASASLRKTLIGNKRLKTKTRCTLVNSLLLSKLFFGDGAWEPLTNRQLKRLTGCVSKLYREACDVQFWRGAAMNDETLMAVHRLLPAPVRIMRDRLCYAAHMVKDGPPHLWPLLWQVHLKQPLRSWISGLENDLLWLQTILPEIKEEPWNLNWETRADFWCMQQPAWDKLVKKAVRRYLQQEATMINVRMWHKRILDRLQGQGALVEHNPFDKEEQELRPHSFTCFCSRSFNSQKDLAVHKAKKHGIHAPEFYLATGTVCGHCLRDCWSTSRLRQHLSYIPRSGGPNPCYEALRLAAPQQTMPPEVVTADASLKGLNRLDARQVEGPRPPADQPLREQRQALLQDLSELEQALKSLGFTEDSAASWWQQLQTDLTTTTQSWFTDWLQDFPHGPDGLDLQQRWFEVLARDTSREYEVVFPFFEWGDELLTTVHEAWENGIAANLVEDQFADMASTFEARELVHKKRNRELRLGHLHYYRPATTPHRPVNWGPANAKERLHRDLQLPGHFHRQPEWKSQLERMTFRAWPRCEERLPLLKRPEAKPIFVVVHLFSGRRRHTDFHAHLCQLCLQEKWDCEILVLSLDTAIEQSAGDLRQQSRTWQHLETWAKDGILAGALAGSPCETYSEARFHPLIDAQGLPIKGPRPEVGRLLVGVTSFDGQGACSAGTGLRILFASALAWHHVPRMGCSVRERTPSTSTVPYSPDSVEGAHHSAPAQVAWHQASHLTSVEMGGRNAQTYGLPGGSAPKFSGLHGQAGDQGRCQAQGYGHGTD